MRIQKAYLLTFFILFIASLFLTHISHALSLQPEQEAYNAWLKNKFSEQHQKIIPVVIVADMFFSCNEERKKDDGSYQIKDLVTNMHRDQLAEKLTDCMAGESLKSEIALNYSLKGCFHEQLIDLPKEEKAIKMKLVLKAIDSLSIEERKKSLTKCVTDQAINYLQ